MAGSSRLVRALAGERIEVPAAELLLHELRHVHQFLERRTFPFSYLWQSIRYGYSRNAYEADARRYATHRLADITAEKEL